MSRRASLLASFRPQSGDIAVSVDDAGRISHTTLHLDEARQLHGSLGGALKLAALAGDPVEAFAQLDVPGEGLAIDPFAVRRAVARVVRGESKDLWSPEFRFARRIAAGEADDSEPMRIAQAAIVAALCGEPAKAGTGGAG